jgi:hypothetical protein
MEPNNQNLESSPISENKSKDRGILLSVWLWLLIISFSFNALFLVSDRMVSIYHFTSSAQRYLFTAEIIINLLLIIFILKWKKLAAYIFFGLQGIGLIYTLIRNHNQLGSPTRWLILVCELIITFLLIRRKWQFFE